MTSSLSVYITSLLSLGICAFISETLCSSFSKGTALSKGLGLISSLCIFTVIISPITLAMKSCGKTAELPKEVNVNTETNENLLEGLTEKDLENRFSDLLSEKLGIQAVYIGIDCNISDSVCDINNINIGLYRKDMESKEQIINLIENETGKNTTISVMKVPDEQE